MTFSDFIVRTFDLAALLPVSLLPLAVNTVCYCSVSSCGKIELSPSCFSHNWSFSTPHRGHFPVCSSTKQLESQSVHSLIQTTPKPAHPWACSGTKLVSLPLYPVEILPAAGIHGLMFLLNKAVFGDFRSLH